MYMQVFISVYAWMEFICTNPIPKSWDTVQIVNKNRMQCGSFKFQYFIQNTTDDISNV